MSRHRVLLIDRKHLGPVEVFGGVGAADSSGVDFEKQLASAGIRGRHLLNANVPWPVTDRRAHFPRLWSPASILRRPGRHYRTRLGDVPRALRRLRAGDRVSAAGGG